MPTNDETVLIPRAGRARPAAQPIEVEYQDARGVTCRVQLSQAMLVGRGDDCGLKIMHSGVSRHHLAIFPEQGRWWARDLSSSNGTLIRYVRLYNTKSHRKRSDTFRQFRP
jgi:pSer/pThr/pTyr-binding forkhead associated (FHA) protein